MHPLRRRCPWRDLQHPCATHSACFSGGSRPQNEMWQVADALADLWGGRGKLKTLSPLPTRMPVSLSPQVLTSECQRYTTRPRPSRQTHTVYSPNHNSPLENKAKHCWSISSWVCLSPIPPTATLGLYLLRHLNRILSARC